MSYLALYRQYRPKRFNEVIGQKHITDTFTNIIKGDKISHAYLLTGTRGVGKTSIAKIFARAINCLHPLEDASPCGECEICLLPENLDIMEIDAASNNGVDEIRELREKVKFHPINSKYKVYIIDEVHMLSPGAFNALLKTLEEPPSHTVFILATTEVHKLPATILSRCMRFDFRQIPQNELRDLVAGVFEKCGQSADADAISLIASNGQGSARDSLSIADMCCSFAPKHISYADVLTVVGASDPTTTLDLAESILDGQVGKVLAEVNAMVDMGKSVNIIARDLIAVFRDIGVCKNASEPESIVMLPLSLLDRLKKDAVRFSEARCVYCVDVLSGIEQDLRYGLSPLIILENALLKCCSVVKNSDLNTLIAKIDELENIIQKERLRRQS